jgi:hypothetical protein
VPGIGWWPNGAGKRSVAGKCRQQRQAGQYAAALASGWVDLVLPLAHIAHALVALTMAPGGADLFRVTSALRYDSLPDCRPRLRAGHTVDLLTVRRSAARGVAGGKCRVG